MSTDEGYIKFNPNWEDVPIQIDNSILNEINGVRSRLKEKEWLGVLPNGIGFGNISVCNSVNEQFIITGSATGHLPILGKEHLALVTRVNIKQNSLMCQGKTVASSESMSHAVFYKFSAAIKSVIHIHNRQLWNFYLGKLPTSDSKIAYGTPQMAKSLFSILSNMNSQSGIIVMGGHQDGIIAFGSSLFEVFTMLKKL